MFLSLLKVLNLKIKYLNITPNKVLKLNNNISLTLKKLNTKSVNDFIEEHYKN